MSSCLVCPTTFGECHQPRELCLSLAVMCGSRTARDSQRRAAEAMRQIVAGVSHKAFKFFTGNVLGIARRCCRTGRWGPDLTGPKGLALLERKIEHAFRNIPPQGLLAGHTFNNYCYCVSDEALSQSPDSLANRPECEQWLSRRRTSSEPQGGFAGLVDVHRLRRP